MQSPPLFPPDFAEKIFAGVWAIYEKALRDAGQQMLDLVLNFIKDNFFLIAGVLMFVFLFLSIKAVYGKWAELGSFLFNCIYHGTLLLGGKIFGVDLFFNDWYDPFCIYVLNPICFHIVGYILRNLYRIRTRRYQWN